MKKLLLLLFILFYSSSSFSQENNLNELIEKGIAYHDAGEYDKAIKEYEKALNINPKSSLVHYEIAFSYFQKGDYKNAEKYSKKSIQLDDQNLLPSYVTLANSLDMQGKPKKALKVYEEALESFDHYLLYYNYAFTSLNQGELDQAYDAVIKAIENNSTHSSSHLLLSEIMDKKGNRIKAMLPLYYFLLLEPNSNRSGKEYKRLTNYMDLGVEKTSPTNININVPMNDDSDFSAAEMMISMKKATNSMDENKDKTQLQLFAENNESLFSILGELKKEKEGFWWELYVPIFYDFAESDLVEPFSYYISVSQGEDATKWLADNEDKFNRFAKWFKK